MSFNDDSWKDSVKLMLDKLIKEQDLPVGSLCLNSNYDGEIGERITSYNIQICEPEYPPRNQKDETVTRKSILSIKKRKSGLELVVSRFQFEVLEKLLHNIEFKLFNHSKTRVQVLFKNNVAEFVNCLELVVKISLYSYKSGIFGCCDRFNECSNAKKCVHENKLYSKACSYRANLESGRIFYGKNRNVD